MKLTYRTQFYPKRGKLMDEASKVDEKILECVNTALKKLGESVTKSIYFYFKKDFSLERFEIPKKPEVLERALVSIFGEQGAKVIEKLILVEIRNTFQLKKGSSSTFEEAVATIKKQVLTHNSNINL